MRYLCNPCSDWPECDECSGTFEGEDEDRCPCCDSQDIDERG